MITYLVSLILLPIAALAVIFTGAIGVGLVKALFTRKKV